MERVTPSLLIFDPQRSVSIQNVFSFHFSFFRSDGKSERRSGEYFSPAKKKGWMREKEEDGISGKEGFELKGKKKGPSVRPQSEGGDTSHLSRVEGKKRSLSSFRNEKRENIQRGGGGGMNWLGGSIMDH